MTQEKMARKLLNYLPTIITPINIRQICLFVHLGFRLPPAKEIKPFWMMIMIT